MFYFVIQNLFDMKKQFFLLLLMAGSAFGFTLVQHEAAEQDKLFKAFLASFEAGELPFVLDLETLVAEANALSARREFPRQQGIDAHKFRRFLPDGERRMFSRMAPAPPEPLLAFRPADNLVAVLIKNGMAYRPNRSYDLVVYNPKGEILSHKTIAVSGYQSLQTCRLYPDLSLDMAVYENEEEGFTEVVEVSHFKLTEALHFKIGKDGQMRAYAPGRASVD